MSNTTKRTALVACVPVGLLSGPIVLGHLEAGEFPGERRHVGRAATDALTRVRMSVEGTVIGGRYRLGPAIGAGGHGTVHHATDMKLGVEVAIKLLHERRGAGDAVEARFEQEAQLARSLRHPNTVRLLDVGRTDDDALFIAYELLAGASLAEMLHEGPLSEARVAHIGIQVLKALMEAHGYGFVHRDIKPSNIFVCSVHGDADFVKVIDFGIAKSTEVGRGITRTGFVVGTPSYMAPEQVRGAAVTAATDIYALGLVLAEALSGKTVVTGTTDAVVAAAQLSPDPVTLPPAVLQSALGSIIVRATRKPVERRYATANEMLDAMLSVSFAASRAGETQVGASASRLSHAPTGVLGAPVVGREKAPSSPSRTLLLLAIVPIVLLVGVAGAVAVGASDAPSAEKNSARSDEDVRSQKKRRKDDASSSAAPTEASPAKAAPSPSLPATPKPIVPGVLGEMTHSELEARLAATGFETSKRTNDRARLTHEGSWHGREVEVIFSDNAAAIGNHLVNLKGPHVASHAERKTANSKRRGLFVVCEEDPAIARLLLGELLGTKRCEGEAAFVVDEDGNLRPRPECR